MTSSSRWYPVIAVTQASEIALSALRVNNWELALISFQGEEWKAGSFTATEFHGAVTPSNLHVPVDLAAFLRQIRALSILFSKCHVKTNFHHFQDFSPVFFINWNWNFGISESARTNRRTKQRFVNMPNAVISVIITWAERKIFKKGNEMNIPSVEGFHSLLDCKLTGLR